MNKLTQKQQTELKARLDGYFKTCRYCKNDKSTIDNSFSEKDKVLVNCDSCNASWNYKKDFYKDKKEQFITEILK